MLETFCLANTSEGCFAGTCLGDGSACICDAGYVRDATVGVYSNCYFEVRVRQALGAIPGIFALLLTIWAGVELVRGAKGVRRKILVSTAVGELFLVGFTLAKYFERYSGWGSSMCLIGTIFFTVGFPIPMILYSSLAPVYSYAKSSMRVLKYFLIAFGLLLPTVPAICFIVALSHVQGDPAMSQNLLTYNLWMEVGYFSIASFAVIVVPAVIVIARSVFHKLKQAKPKPSPESRAALGEPIPEDELDEYRVSRIDDRMEDFRIRVRTVQIQIVTFYCLFFVMSVSVLVIVFTTNFNFPRRYIPAFITIMAIPVLGSFNIFFTRTLWFTKSYTEGSGSMGSFGTLVRKMDPRRATRVTRESGLQVTDVDLEVD